ncbi:MAG: RAMP superfamily CRISPR-associated protein [Chloroflexus sp.]|uniref:RAMP superfamily CRISPR-associated protein n=1 Tax=Chloroflexus sp. TaxID=1904827 RepID=UPI003D129239
MQRDYYAFKRVELNSSLNDLEQAVKDLENAKQAKDKNARDKAESQMKQVASRAVSIEPHLAYLWFEAHNSELDNSIRDAWQKSLKASAIPQAFHFTPDLSAVAHLPSLSFLLHIPFKLHKPYHSKDERDFYLLENPLRREKVFQTPMMASTSWKGALRSAMRQQRRYTTLNDEAKDMQMIRLFGNVRAAESDFVAGRLTFFPTFFDKVGLEVINPHDRTTGVGARGPILLECVPQGAQGDFFVLYVPFGPFEQSDDDRRAEIADDLHAVAEGVRDMLTVYGFGAKTSSGFGIAEASEGKLVLRAKLAGGAAPAVAPPAPQQPELARYLESPTRLHPDLRREDGTLKSEAEYQRFIESQGRKYGKQEKQLYDKAKKWWEREGQALAQQTPTPTPEPAPPEPSPVTTFTFQTLSELGDVAQRVAKQLRKGDAS